MRLVSRTGDVVLRPGPHSSVRIEGDITLGSGDSSCDDARRGRMRFMHGGAGADQVLVCVSDGSSDAAWVRVCLL
jgi:hypothetical protein